MSAVLNLQAWPVCVTPRTKTDPTPCNTSYVLRRGLSWTKGWIWVWGPDCKHKGDKAVVEFHDQYGPMRQTEDGSYIPNDPPSESGPDDDDVLRGAPQYGNRAP